MYYCGLQLVDTFLSPPVCLHIASNYSFYAQSLYLTYQAKTGDRQWNKFRIWTAYYTKNIPERCINTRATDLLLQRKRPLCKIFCKLFCYWPSSCQGRKLTRAIVKWLYDLYMFRLLLSVRNFRVSKSRMSWQIQKNLDKPDLKLNIEFST
jgi:hypothetical protein